MRLQYLMFEYTRKYVVNEPAEEVCGLAANLTQGISTFHRLHAPPTATLFTKLDLVIKYNKEK